MKKPLPILNQPSIVATLPICKKDITFRPFVVREQQSLLLAQESGDPKTIYETIKSAISTCTNGTLDVSKLALADLAYFFLQMHISSVGNTIDLTLKCDDCETKVEYPLDLNDVKVSEVKSNKIMLTPTVGIVFRYPTYEDTVVFAEFASEPVKGVYHIVESIFDEDMVYTKSDYSSDEFAEWLSGMSDKQLEKLFEFVDSVPDLFYMMDWTCPKCKKKHSKRLEGLQTFFRLSYEYGNSGRLLSNKHNSDDGVQSESE